MLIQTTVTEAVVEHVDRRVVLVVSEVLHRHDHRRNAELFALVERRQELRDHVLRGLVRGLRVIAFIASVASFDQGVGHVRLRV